MKDNENNNDAAQNAEASADQTNSDSTIADKLYGDDANKEADVSKDDENNNDQLDSSKSADEASKTDEDKSKDEDSKDDSEDDGEESKQGDDKKYDEVVLPEDLPEGMEVDQRLFDATKEIAQKHNIPKEALQELVDTYAREQVGKHTEVAESWANAVEADKEIGGDRLKQTQEHCKAAMARFSTPELSSLLNDTGLGNHPELVRVFSKIGKSMSEGGKFQQGNNTSQRSAADILYDKS
jgi:hypothetical protein